MDAGEKGQRYAKLFRKAGVLLSRGRIERAIEVLKEGAAMAEQLGDHAMARRFAAEIERAAKSPDPAK